MNEKWTIGRKLTTQETLRWSKKDWQEFEAAESRRIYRHSTEEGQSRSRKLVAVFTDKEDAALTVSLFDKVKEQKHEIGWLNKQVRILQQGIRDNNFDHNERYNKMRKRYLAAIGLLSIALAISVFAHVYLLELP